MRNKLALLAFTLLPALSSAQLTGIANDCLDAIPICSNESYSTGGTVSQGDQCDITAVNRGCIGGTAGTSDPYPTGSAQEVFCRYEYSPTFFYFKIRESGILEFMAGNSGADLDFALYGPVTGPDRCAYLRATPPIRCNFNSAPGGGTGMINNGGGGPTSPISANLNVTAGEVYVLLIQQWGFPPSPVGFDLLFNEGTGANDANSTATFDCSILPVELVDFRARATSEGVLLEWKTALESFSSHFNVQRSTNTHQWENVGAVPAAGHSVQLLSYRYLDTRPGQQITYYRLVQVDENGAEEYSRILAVNPQAADCTNPVYIDLRGLQYLSIESAPAGVYFRTCGGGSQKVFKY